MRLMLILIELGLICTQTYIQNACFKRGMLLLSDVKKEDNPHT